MPIDKNSPTHLYIQIADSIRAAVTGGAYPPGGTLPTEAELCRDYGVSRFPMRQAMAILVEEGLLRRVRGKGTFVTERLPGVAAALARSSASRLRSLALVLPGFAGDLPVDILRGFERAAAESGLVAVVATAGSPEMEKAVVDRVIDAGAAGVVLFPTDNTRLNERALNGWAERGVYLCVIDRNPGFDGVDYVGSDNFGGGYLAAHHMHLRGYGAAVYVADQFGVSSVRERHAGFMKGLERFGMRLIPEGWAEGDASHLSLGAFVESLARFHVFAPFAVFSENDYVAERVLLALQEGGYAVGGEAGVIGFDNSTRCDFLTPKLTSVAQNGYLIGQTAARLAAEKLESGSRQSVRHILPTQLAARRSCGEGRGL